MNEPYLHYAHYEDYLKNRQQKEYWCSEFYPKKDMDELCQQIQEAKRKALDRGYVGVYVTPIHEMFRVYGSHVETYQEYLERIEDSKEASLRELKYLDELLEKYGVPEKYK